MKGTSIARAFAITLAAALALSIGPQAQSQAYKLSDSDSAAALAAAVAPRPQEDDKECSNRTLNGTFAFTSSGFITAPPALAGPFAIVGRQTFDGHSAFTATATVSQNGTISPVTLEGTYAVSPNCTGTFKAYIPPVNITTHLFFVLDDNGKEFQVIQTDPGVVVTGIARRQ